jgi:diguanylate cyclase (GGDEF)-like protein
MESGSLEHLQQRVLILESELEEANKIIRDLSEKLGAALDGTGLCLWQGHPQTGELKVFNLQGFAPQDMASCFEQWLAKLHPEDRGNVLNNYFSHLGGKTLRYEAEYRTVDSAGRVTWLWDLGRVVEWDLQGRPIRMMGAHFDITKRKASEEEMERQAQSDPLTGLFNRRMMLTQLRMEYSRALRQSTPFSIVMIDIDHFKQINDNYGHDVGDLMLVRLGQALNKALRNLDVCARWGGEEFLLLLSQTSIEQALQVAERVQEEICEISEWVDGQTLHITASLGIAQFRPNDSEAELLRKADTALLQAKRRGRNCTVVWSAG